MQISVIYWYKTIYLSFGKKCNKYFIDYKDGNYKIKSLCVMLPKMSGYAKSVDDEWIVQEI